MFGAGVFVFCNRARDRVKILEWDEGGFWLYFKRLEKGHFRWPALGEESTMSLSGEELNIVGRSENRAEAEEERSANWSSELT